MKTKLELSEDDYGSRLDVVLTRHLGENSRSSRSYCARLVSDGAVVVNDKTSRVSYKGKSGDEIIVERKEKEIKPIDFEILYKDDNVVVINKPLGILSHAKGEIAEEFTVADFIKQYFSGTDSNRAGIVHRLDRTTSGVMICARTDESAKFLQKQFAKRNVKKSYVAVVEGILKDDQALLDLPIERNPKRPSTFRAGPNGKPAQTELEVVSRSEDTTLVKLSPHTGRTHQLRVHMAFIGHPVVGDELYGAQPSARVMLHATRLEITLPSSERKVFEAPTPEEFTV